MIGIATVAVVNGPHVASLPGKLRSNLCLPSIEPSIRRIRRKIHILALDTHPSQHNIRDLLDYVVRWITGNSLREERFASPRTRHILEGKEAMGSSATV